MAFRGAFDTGDARNRAIPQYRNYPMLPCGSPVRASTTMNQGRIASGLRDNVAAR
jgi:hypothetical protein